jgi:C1A family cysteine protease
MTVLDIRPPTRDGWGWKRQAHHDIRDHLLFEDQHFLEQEKPETLPQTVDLRPYFPAFSDDWDQGQVGACTGYSCAAIIASTYLGADPPRPDFKPAPLFLYYNARSYEGTTRSDSGAYIRDVVRGANEFGVCQRDLWPKGSAISRKPGQNAYDESPAHKITEYLSVPMTREGIFYTLAAEYPVLIGFTVYPSMVNAPRGEVPMPSRNEKPIGGHAIALVGYEVNRDRIWFRNSWGIRWGQEGYGSFPADFICSSQYADDAWCLRQDALG